jgi:hypothetical protein
MAGEFEAEWEVGVMRMGWIFAATLVASVLLGGCASVKVVRVDPAKVHGAYVEGSKAQTTGVLFYRPRAYLMVTQGPAAKDAQSGDAAGGKPLATPGPAGGTAEPRGDGKPAPAAEPTLNVQIIWLPDYSQEYEIQAHPGLGSVTMNPTLKDGWNLAGLSATVDSKTAELITAAAGLASAVPKVVAADRTSEANVGPPCTGLYPIEVDRTTGLITGVAKPVIRFENPSQCNDLR